MYLVFYGCKTCNIGIWIMEEGEDMGEVKIAYCHTCKREIARPAQHVVSKSIEEQHQEASLLHKQLEKQERQFLSSKQPVFVGSNVIPNKPIFGSPSVIGNTTNFSFAQVLK